MNDLTCVYMNKVVLVKNLIKHNGCLVAKKEVNFFKEPEKYGHIAALCVPRRALFCLRHSKQIFALVSLKDLNYNLVKMKKYRDTRRIHKCFKRLID